MTYFAKFKKTFSYTWYLYLLAIILPSIIFPLSYSFMHRAKQNETLSLFLPCDLKVNDAESLLYNKFKSLDIRVAEIINYNPDISKAAFSDKLGVVGYSRCDVIIIPDDFLSTTGIYTAALELNNQVKELCKIEKEDLYKFEEVDYGVKIPKDTPILEFSSLKEDLDYYAFLNYKSWNIGEYSQSKIHTENAFKLMQYVLGKYDEK